MTLHGHDHEPLTPFVGRLRSALELALGALIRVPEGASLRWREQRGALRFEVASGAQLEAELRLDDGVPARGSVARHGLRLQLLSPARGALASAAFRALAARVVGGFEAASAEAVQQLSARFAEWLPFAEVEDDYLRRIGQSTGGQSGMIRVGFRCNQDCGFCWQGRGWPEPPETLYRTWIDELAAAGARNVVFSGGEPTLHAGLFELIRHAAARGLRAQLQTNAIRLARPDYVAGLRDAGLVGALVSLHASDAELSDRMTRARGTFVRTVAGIRAALAGGLQVGLNCVVERDNAARLAEHARFVVETFVTPFPDNPVAVVNYSHPSPYHDRALWSAQLADPAEVAPALTAALRTLGAASVATHATGSCGFPPCLFHDAPELVPWRSRDDAHEVDLSARSFVPECAGCAVRGHCPGLRPEVVAVHGSRGVRPFAVRPAALEALLSEGGP